MVVNIEGNFVQKKAVGTGSCVAPALSDLLVARYDRHLEASLQSSNVSKVFRYVDDYLVILRSSTVVPTETIYVIHSAFDENLQDLQTTKEVPIQGELRFLNLLLVVHEDHICWSYYPWSRKNSLSYPSAHSKLVKRGIGYSAMRNALIRSFPQWTRTSFMIQVERSRARCCLVLF